MGFQTLPFFLPLLSVWEVFFLNHVSPLRTPKQLTKHSFGPVLSPAPGEELRMTASAKSQIERVIQGQIPPHCELPSGTPKGD